MIIIIVVANSPFHGIFLIQIMAVFSGTETEIIAKGLICSKFQTAYNKFIMCMLWLARVQAYWYLLNHLDSVLDNVLIYIHPFYCTERMIFQPRKSMFASSELSMLLHCYTLCWSFRLYRSCFHIIIQSSIHIRLFLGSFIKIRDIYLLAANKGATSWLCCICVCLRVLWWKYPSTSAWFIPVVNC